MSELKLVSQQQVNLIQSMGSDLIVVNSARVSFGDTSATLESKDEKLIKYLADHKHNSTFEHCTATFLVKCPIYISKQIMRHRTFSYNEISRRYTSKDLEFFVPSVYRKQAVSNRQASEGEVIDQGLVDLAYQSSIKLSVDAYQGLINSGVCREQARGVLPQTTMTEFYMTGNLRNWAHFLELRLPKDAQGEIQEIAQMIRQELQHLFPVSLLALIPGDPLND